MDINEQKAIKVDDVTEPTTHNRTPTLTSFLQCDTKESELVAPSNPIPVDDVHKIVKLMNAKDTKLTKTSLWRLRRLVNSGVDYKSALESVIKYQKAKDANHVSKKNKTQHYLTKSQTNNNMRSCTSNHESQIVDGIKVGIVHSDAGTRITYEQSNLIQTAILEYIFSSEDDGTQVRFHGCFDKPGWLLIICADEQSVEWLDQCVRRLQPWKGADLRIVQGSNLPLPHACTVNISNTPKSGGLSAEQVLIGLKRMNNMLSTDKWKVVNHEVTLVSSKWTFAMDDHELYKIEELDMKPFFGLGRIDFCEQVSYTD